MADSAISIDINLGIDNATRELERLKKKMTKTEMEVSEKKLTAKNLKAELDEAKEILDDFQREYAEKEGVGVTDDNLGREIESQKKHVEELEQAYAKVNAQIQSQKRDLANNQDLVGAMTEKVKSEAEARTETSDETEEEKDNEEDLGEEVDDVNTKLEEQSQKVKDVNENTKHTPTLFEKIGTKLTQMTKRVFVFSMITSLFRSVRSAISGMIEKNSEASASLAQLKAAFATMVAPVMNVVIPVLTRLIQILTTIVAKIATFLSALFGGTINKSKQLAKSMGSVGSAAKKASKQLAAFDEIQKLSDDSSDGSGGGGGLDFGFGAGDTSKLEEWAAAFRKIFDSLTEAWDYFNTMVLQPFITLIMSLWNLINEKLLAALQSIGDWMEEHQGEVNLWLTLLGSIALAALTLYTAFMLVKGVIAAITLLLNTPIVLIGILIGLFAALAVHVGTAGEMITTFKKLFADAVELISAIIDGDWDRAWKAFQNIMIDALNLCIEGFSTLVKGMAEGINWVIDKINSLGFSFAHVDINSWGWINYRIPRLAEGAVIPPNREFMAVLGDQKSGYNIETPLATMIDAFNTALDSRGGNGGNQTIILEVDGTQFGKVVYNANRRETKRVGVKMAEVTG